MRVCGLFLIFAQLLFWARPGHAQFIAASTSNLLARLVWCRGLVHFYRGLCFAQYRLCAARFPLQLRCSMASLARCEVLHLCSAPFRKYRRQCATTENLVQPLAQWNRTSPWVRHASLSQCSQTDTQRPLIFLHGGGLHSLVLQAPSRARRDKLGGFWPCPRKSASTFLLPRCQRTLEC